MDDLKKQIRAIDLAVLAGRKRQSPRTGFVHLFVTDEMATDTIPLYENFCFALALFRQKTSETVIEGKELLERLLPFQTSNGNFPAYLHDYPRCWDFSLPLKIAPIFIHLLRHFSSVLGAELKEKIEKSLAQLLQCPQKDSPLWEQRARACKNESLLPFDPSQLTASEWVEWIITCQLADPQANAFPIPYHPELQTFLGPNVAQEKGDPRSSPLEWILAEGAYSPRLLRDHPHQLLSAPLLPFTTTTPSPHPFALGDAFRFLWHSETLHSLSSSKTTRFERLGKKTILWFEENPALFCNLSEEVELFVEGQKATVFRLGQTVQIRTSKLTIECRFDLIEGEGDFCGHLFRSNRPSQISCKGPLLYEAYDWHIGLRILRSSEKWLIRATLQL
ncbi:MAG TPA: hypothetical protein VLE89_00160 [Chlamydiales bacterium]|nr:hypothetical protein [Chlamydiales bacterium]